MNRDPLHRFRHDLLATVCAIALSGAVKGAAASDILGSAVAWKLTPSIALAIVDNGKLAYTGVRGSADLDNRRPATLDTRYPIGSLGTLFLAVAIVQLDAKGKLHLDDSLEHYVSSPAGDVTLRQLLPPREDDDNYEALAAVIERVTGEPLIAYLTDHVFRPAGMTQTWFGEPPDWLPVAVGYSEWKDVFGPVQTPADAWNRKCCSFVSTATDLAHFDIALFNGKLISPEALQAMRPAFQSAKRSGIIMLGRQGSAEGYDAENILVMEQRFAIVTLANSAGFAATAVLDRALAHFYPSLAASAADEPADENLTVTARLREFLVTQEPSLGGIRSMALLSTSTSEGLTEYRYLIDAGSGTKSAFFLVGSDGKVNGFWMH